MKSLATLSLFAAPLAFVTGGTLTERPGSVVSVDRVETKQLVIKDGHGKPRATLGVDGSDVLRFSASSDKQDDTFLLSVFPDGRAALLLRDAHGRNRLALSIRQDGRPILGMDENATILLRDKRGRNRAVLRAHEDGQPELLLQEFEK